MQVVRIKELMMLCLLIQVACSQNLQGDFLEHDNQGGYTYDFVKLKTSLSNSIFVNGRILDYQTKNELGGSFVQFYCEKVKSDEYGYYEFNIPSRLDNDLFFKAISIGYKTVVTGLIHPVKMDTLNLDFYLEIDKTPLYHCDN